MIKVNGKWRFAPVVERDGNIVRDLVLINGAEENHSEGRYYLEWHEGGRRRRKGGPIFEDLVAAARTKFIELHARRAGLLPAPEPEHLTIDDAINQYLDYIRKQKSHRTYLTYRPTLTELFRNSYTKTYLDEVTREDILKFVGESFESGLTRRTVYNKLVTVLQFFKQYGYTELIKSSDWPVYVGTIRPVYTPEEIYTLLKAATHEEQLLLKFFLASGFRKDEVRYATWHDVDFHNSLVRVTAKPFWKFKPKNYEERAVPLPTAMIEQLREWKNKNDAAASDPIFPNTKGKPNSIHIEVLKRVAYRAKLNCGQCTTKHGNTCAAGAHCERFFLHKFRHTFATQHLHDGIDIRTLQHWLGHSDMESTIVYLKGIQAKDALTKVNAGALASYVV
jgi:integrase